MRVPLVIRKSFSRQVLSLLRSIIWPPHNQSNQLDLIVPRPGYKIDNYALWIARDLIPFWQSVRKYFHARERHQEPWDIERGEVTLVTYSEHIVDFRSTITTFLACLLPTGAIAILSSIHQTGVLIGVIGVFTALFAIGLMFFTSKRPSRVEVFSATAA